MESWSLRRERYRLRREWGAQRQSIADEFCAGSLDKAEAMLMALPYSSIPDWEDVRTVIEVFDRCRAKEE